MFRLMKIFVRKYSVNFFLYLSRLWHALCATETVTTSLTGCVEPTPSARIPADRSTLRRPAWSAKTFSTGQRIMKTKKTPFKLI